MALPRETPNQPLSINVPPLTLIVPVPLIPSSMPQLKVADPAFNVNVPEEPALLPGVKESWKKVEVLRRTVKVPPFMVNVPTLFAEFPGMKALAPPFEMDKEPPAITKVPESLAALPSNREFSEFVGSGSPGLLVNRMVPLVTVALPTEAVSAMVGTLVVLQLFAFVYTPGVAEIQLIVAARTDTAQQNSMANRITVRPIR